MKCTRKCTGLLLAAALTAQVVMPGAQVEAKKASKPVLSKKTVKVKEKTKKKHKHPRHPVATVFSACSIS